MKSLPVILACGKVSVPLHMVPLGQNFLIGLGAVG